MKIFSTEKAPKAIWHYSQAIRVWDLLFCSGQIWLNPETMILVDWIEKQTEQVCDNIWEILKEAGISFSNVVKTTIFLSDISDFQTVNEIYSKYFSHKPARSTIEVSALPKWAHIEIEVIASF